MGRKQELESLLEGLRSGRRALLISGAPGIGKTALARRVADTVRKSAEVLWCDLSGARDGDELLYALATQVQAVLPARGTRGVQALAAVLAERSVKLLVLDGMDGSIDEASTIVRAFASGKGPRVLATAQTRLLCPSALHVRLGALSIDDATELFHATALEVGAEISDPAGVEKLIAQVDGVPLAIDMAASWMETLTPTQLLRRLREDFEVLDRSPRRLGKPMSTALNRAWMRLSRWEKAVLMTTATFDGGFELEAVEDTAVVGETAPSTLALVTALRERSLLEVYAPEGFPEELRMRVPAFVQGFVLEQLRRSGWQGAAWAQHAEWALKLASDLTENSAAGERAALDRLSLERANLAVVPERRRDNSRKDGRRAVAALIALDRLFAIRGPFDERLPNLRRAEELAAPLGPDLRKRAAVELARALVAQGRAQEALDTLVEVEKPLHEPDCVSLVVAANRMKGDVPEAREILEAALLAMPQGTLRWELQLEAARLDARQGDTNEAARKLRLALEGYGHPDQDRRAGEVALELAKLYELRGEPGESLRLGREVLTGARQRRDRPCEGQALLRLGWGSLAQSSHDEAQQYAEAAAAVLSEVEDPRGLADAVVLRAALAEDQGDLGSALRDLTEACRRWHELEDPFEEGQAALHRAIALQLADRGTEAAPLATDATEMLERAGAVHAAALGNLVLATILTDIGETAHHAFEAGVAMLAGNEEPQLAIHMELARAHVFAFEDDKDARRIYWSAAGTSDLPGSGEGSWRVRRAARALAKHLRTQNSSS